MGTSRSVAQLEKKLKESANTIPRTMHRAVNEAAMEGKAIVMAEMKVAGLTPGKPLSGDRRKRPVNVRYEMKSEKAAEGSTWPRAYLQMRGPASWMEVGTVPHLISPRHNNRRMVNKRLRVASMLGAMSGQQAPGIRGTKGAINVFGGKDGWRAYVRHPGHEGKGYWSRSAKAIRVRTPEVVRKAIGNGMRSVWR